MPFDTAANRIEPLPAAAMSQPATPASAPRLLDPRTRRLLEAPIATTLIKLAAPNIVVMLVQAGVGLIETYFVGKLGTAALAGMALVFPPLMLMQMMSAGAVGGGISSAVARALGRGNRDDADRLAVHAAAVALAFGLIFSAAMLTGGQWLYMAMGGEEASLAAAVTYSNIVFAGVPLLWLFNALASVVRGAGNMAVPAIVTCAGAAVLIPLSPCLIFGWGRFPALGIAGGGIAVVCYYAIGTAVLATYLMSRRSVARLKWRGARFEARLFRDIMRVGAVAAVVTLQTNLTIAIVTSIVGRFGAAAIAGYGTGTRLEYLLVPLVFGLGGPLVAMVGTNIGAGQRERALRTAWIGAAIAFALTETIGLAAAAAPLAWLSLFDTDPAMLSAGAAYLRIVGPAYGFFGLGIALYFASQGAGRLLWPLLAGSMRLVVAAGGGALALYATGALPDIYVALAVGLVMFGSVNAVTVGCGGWFGALRWPDIVRMRSGKT